MNNNISIQELKSIKQMLNCSTCRLHAFDKLSKIDTVNLIPGLQMYYHYICGKYYHLLFTDSGNINDLKKSADQYEQIFIVADTNNVSPKNPKYYFKVAYTKYLLVNNNSLKLSDQDKMIQTIEILITKGLEISNSSSLYWLRSELKSLKSKLGST